jgi:hypothetical protein
MPQLSLDLTEGVATVTITIFMFCITTSGERRMRAAISRAIRLLARPCCPW